MEDEIGNSIRRFWRAGAEEDSAELRQLSNSELPVRWAFGIDSMKPGFFERTAHDVRVIQAVYTGRADFDAWVELEVPWVTCRPPAHDGRKDRYQARVQLLDGKWRIIELAGRIC